MSFYDDRLLPRLVHTAMRLPGLDAYRQRAARAAHGVVLELGFGSGLNLPFYDAAQVTRLHALEPSEALLALAKDRIARAGFPVDVLRTGAERIALADDSVDTVLCTWTLCSIPDVRRALAETRRVLRPGGRFVFVEHGLSPDERVGRWQRRLTPLWRRCAGGCHLDRKTDALVQAAGLGIEGLRTGYMGPVKVLGYLYEGSATRAG